MCGIAGFLNLTNGAPPSLDLAQSMLAQIRHRGPDEFGIYHDEHVAMGNARLSIVDLSGGTQPISNETGDLWIVYNGEVFNYPELRADLEARGHVFATHSDTEVIVHAFEEYGPDCLSRLNGQWAIALWDRRTRTLFLARDRLGVRPLFYTTTRDSLVFGSEIKSLFAHPQVTRALDPTGVAQVFTYWTPCSPRSCFEGVRELPPGHYAIVRDGQIDIRRYWELEFPPADGAPAKRFDEKATIEEFRSLLIDATSIRLMRADVPVGAYLSGGLDSSVIASIVRRIGKGKLDTFSIAFSDNEFDESGPQRQMAQFLGTEHQVVQATHSDIARIFPDVVWHTETPLTRTAPVPMFLLSRLVNDRNYKVVLTGEGADEFLAGYDIFKEAKIRRFWARQPDSKLRPQLLRRLYPEIARLGASAPSFLAAFFGAGLRDTGAPDYSHRIRWRNNRRSFRFFAPEFLARAGAGEPGADLHLPKAFSSWGPLQQAQYIEASVFLSGYLLSSQGDRMAMAHAVEGRYPFLDVRVVEFCNRLPAEFKMRGLREKWLLREAFRGWLPDEIITRRKRPYRAPIRRSFATADAPDYIADVFSPSSIRQSGIFNPIAAEKLYASVRQGKEIGETDEMALVGILSTEILHRKFVADYAPRSVLTGRDRIKTVDGSRSGVSTPPRAS